MLTWNKSKSTLGQILSRHDPIWYKQEGVGDPYAWAVWGNWILRGPGWEGPRWEFNRIFASEDTGQLATCEKGILPSPPPYLFMRVYIWVKPGRWALHCEGSNW